MAATYTPIALQEMREVLRSDKGWRAVRDEGCEEHVYEFALKGLLACGFVAPERLQRTKEIRDAR